MATMTLDSFLSAKCRIAPEMPTSGGPGDSGARLRVARRRLAGVVRSRVAFSGLLSLQTWQVDPALM